MLQTLITPFIEVCLISLSAGLLYGIFGSGSGLIMTPGYYFVLRHFHMTQSHAMQMAIATTAAGSAVLGFFSAKVQYKQNYVDIPAFRHMFPGLICGTISAIILVNFIPSLFLKKLFGVVVIIVAIWLITYNPQEDKKPWRLAGATSHILSFCITFLWFLLGVAVFITPYLHKCNVSLRRCIGTASFTSAIFSAIGGILFTLVGSFVIGISWQHIGYLHLFIFVSSLIPGAVGGYIGTKLSIRLPTEYLKKYYALLIIVVGTLMIL